MAAKPIAMEQLKQVLMLYKEGQSIKGIVRLTGLALMDTRTCNQTAVIGFLKFRQTLP